MCNKYYDHLNVTTAAVTSSMYYLTSTTQIVNRKWKSTTFKVLVAFFNKSSSGDNRPIEMNNHPQKLLAEPATGNGHGVCKFKANIFLYKQEGYLIIRGITLSAFCIKSMAKCCSWVEGAADLIYQFIYSS